ncbi:MAG: DUF1697 domain-containing protein [Bacteroidales bacterium]|nr:DUF1697 domain-containing protein [Bacteroidales bacterium]
METRITMLRGINMTGHNSIKMTRLADMFRQLGYADAETYIQSGNIVFTAHDGYIDDISSGIRRAILSEFNLNIAVITRTLDEMKEIVSVNPFLGEPNFDPSKMAVLFLEYKPSEEQILKVAGIDYPPDKFQINGSEIYIYCPNGFGKTKLYTNFFEAKMKVTGTARNWRTVNKLMEMAVKKNKVPDKTQRQE